jgi:arabinofuranosyltransferase
MKRFSFVLSRPWARVALAAILAVYLVACLGYVYRTSFVVEGERVYLLWDDAMISMRYARNALEGRGLVWNPGERVQGFTNLGLTLLMVPLHALPLSANVMPLAFQIVSVVWLLTILYFVAELTARLARSRAAGIVAALVLALFAPLGIWGIQGADSAALALVLLVASLQVERCVAGGAKARGVFLTLAVGVLIRLDFSLDYALFLAFLVWAKRERRETLAMGLGVLGIVVGGMLVFGAAYYGDPLPNTYYLKATGARASAMIAAGVYRFFYWNVADGFWVSLALFAAYLPRLAKARPTARVLAAIVVMTAAYYVRVGGDWFLTHMSRFLVPAIPLYVTLIVAGAHLTWRRLVADRRARAAILALHVPVLALSMNKRVSLAEWWSPSAETMLKKYNVKNLEYARFLSRYSAPDTVVGVYWAGAMPYHCDRPMLDLLGKADAHIARVRVTDEKFAPGHAKRDWDYVLDRRKPDLLMAEMDEMKDRPDYKRDYCVLDTPVWLASRLDSLGKLSYPGLACRSAR